MFNNCNISYLLDYSSMIEQNSYFFIYNVRIDEQNYQKIEYHVNDIAQQKRVASN